MLFSPALLPLLHGEAGILDELLLFGAPLIVVLIILAVANRRAQKNAPRERASQHPSNDHPHSPDQAP